MESRTIIFYDKTFRYAEGIANEFDANRLGISIECVPD
jgi:hypothetical protein